MSTEFMEPSLFIKLSYRIVIIQLMGRAFQIELAKRWQSEIAEFAQRRQTIFHEVGQLLQGIREHIQRTREYLRNRENQPTTYIATTKVKVISKKRLEENCQSECVICIDTLKYKNAIRTECNHYYCHECWNQWMKCSTSCPTCRMDRPRTTRFKGRTVCKKPAFIIEEDTDEEVIEVVV